MNLDIDIGNTRIKWRVVDGADVVDRGVQLTESIRQGSAFDIGALKHIDRVRLSCVAEQDIVKKLQSQCRNQLGVWPQLAEVSERAASVVCGYQDYSQLGVDRWLALVAAYNKFNASVIVVDAGSAVTIDIVEARGVHLGGYIVPGLNLMHQALWQGTKQVKVEAAQLLDIDSPGKTTQQAVDRGCLLMLVAMIERLVAKSQSRLVITGGDAEQLHSALSVDAILCPELVLEGLDLEGICLGSTAA